MTQRIGIVTGGGDCPGLNAVIRAVAKAAAQRGWETIGFLGGYEGLLDPQRYHAARLPAARPALDPRAAPSWAPPTAAASRPRPATASRDASPRS